MLRITLIALIGCNRDVTPDKAPTESSTCNEDSDCGDGTICESSACIDGDRNNSADESISLLWEEQTTEWIEYISYSIWALVTGNVALDQMAGPLYGSDRQLASTFGTSRVRTP